MRIAVVGAGALGLYYGAMLHKAGADVHFLLRRDYAAVVAKGVTVHSINGDFHLYPVQAYRHPEDIGIVDLVVVGLKTFANDALAALTGPLVGPQTQILTLQNGLGNEELLADLHGSRKIVGGVAFLCSNRGEPGVVHHLGAGRIAIGEFEKHDASRLDKIAEVFIRAGVECRPVTDLKRARWEKLVWNIPFNGLCALLQQPVDQLLCVPATRSLVRSIMIEVIQAGNAQGLTEDIPETYADAMLAFTDGMGPYKPSMHIDREEGRMLEIGAIFRCPLAYGARAGIRMALTEMLATLLEQQAVVSCS